MNCLPDLIEAYLDQELDPGTRSAVEEHLAGCAGCSAIRSRLVEQKAEIRASAPYYAAPAELQRSVREALRQLAPRDLEARTAGVPWRWLAIAATLLLAFSVYWNIRGLRPRVRESDLLAQNLVADHIRSLIGTHLLDVPSSDQHTVKPWFNGKLDFSPEVKDFTPQGFPLLGGRLDYLVDRSVAALVYGRRQHIINVFTWPSNASPAADQHLSQNGYHAIQWNHGAMTFWAISDVSVSDLQQLRALYEQ